MSAPLPVGAAPRLLSASTVTLVIALITGVQFFVALEGSMLLPLGPILAAQLHFPVEHMGYVNGAFFISASIAGIIGSLTLDRFDRRMALSIALAGLAVGTAIAGFAHSLEALVGCRVLAGICGGPAVSLGMAVISDATPVAVRGRAIGTVSAGSGVALVLGVPMALQIAEWTGVSGTFFTVGGVGLLLALGAFIFLPTGLGRRSIGSNIAQAVGDFIIMLKRRDTQLVLANGALVMSSINILAANLASFFVYNLGSTPHSLKYLWMAGGVAGVITGQVCGRLTDRIGPFKVLASISALAILLYIVMFMLGGLGLPLMLMMPVFLTCATGRIVMSNTVASLTAPPELRGRFMSLMSASNQAAAATAVFTASHILYTAADGKLMNMDKLAVYAGVTCVISPLIVRILMRRKKAI